MRTDRGDGRRPFVAAVRNFAEHHPGVPLRALIEHVDEPVRVAVRGRPGVGASTVSDALRSRGVHVVPEACAELLVLVVAEVLKPEDRVPADLPTLVVATKADLGGSAAVPGAVPMIGLLAAVTALDEQLVEALRTCVADPPDLRSVDAFVETAHPVDRDVRVRLLDRLDRCGVAAAVRALADGADAVTVVDTLHRMSNVDGVLARLQEVAAPVRYRRVQQALAELRALAAGTDDERLWRFLASDAAVVAQMAAAADVLTAAGWDVHRTETDAVQWNRYTRGPLDALHSACAADMVRAALRTRGRVQAC